MPQGTPPGRWNSNLEAKGRTNRQPSLNDDRPGLKLTSKLKHKTNTEKGGACHGKTPGDQKGIQVKTHRTQAKRRSTCHGKAQGGPNSKNAVRKRTHRKLPKRKAKMHLTQQLEK